MDLHSTTKMFLRWWSLKMEKSEQSLSFINQEFLMDVRRNLQDDNQVIWGRRTKVWRKFNRRERRRNIWRLLLRKMLMLWLGILLIVRSQGTTTVLNSC